MLKQYQAVLGSTKMRDQKPVPVIPTLSHAFAVTPIQLILGWSSVLAILPPNPAVCLRVGVWGKTWDNAENFSAIEGPQFHFYPGDKNRQDCKLQTSWLRA